MNTKKTYINDRIPVIKEEVAPEIYWVTFQLATQIETDFFQIIEKCKQINSTIHHFAGMIKSFNVSKYDGTDYQPLMEQVEMDIGAVLLKQCLDGLNDMEFNIAEARRSIKQSCKMSRMKSIKVFPPEKEVVKT